MYSLDINQLINNTYPNTCDIVCIPVFRKTECLHAICALGNDFENRGGGYILIGVKNNLSEGSYAVTGLKDLVGEDLISEIFELTNFIFPKISVIPELITFEDKHILVLKVKSPKTGPYRARETLSGSGTKNPPFFFYIKKGLKISKASAIELETLISACSLIPFDEREFKNSEECMLSLHLIHEFLIKNDRVTYTEINQLNLLETLKYLNLLTPKSLQHYPLNAAGLLFSYHPEKLFRATYTDVIIKNSSNPSKSTRTRFTGPLFRQVEDVLDFIKSKVIKGKDPLDENCKAVFNYPYEAIKQIFINALLHRSYEIHEPVTITVEDDRLTILSLPGPDKSITDNDLKTLSLHAVRKRNRVLIDFFCKSKLASNMDSGFEIIKKECLLNGSALPVLTTDSERSFFKVVFEIHNEFNEKSVSKTETESVESEKKTYIKKHRTRKNHSAKEIEELLLEALRENQALSTTEIASLLGYNRPTTTLTGIITDLRCKGIIAYTIPHRPKSKNQKLTLVKKKF